MPSVVCGRACGKVIPRSHARESSQNRPYTAFARHTLRKSPQGMPCWSLFAVGHAEASVNHAAAESANDVSYGTLREPCQQKTFLRSVSRKLPKTMPQRSAFAAHLTEASEKHGANGYPCGISHGRLRTMNREENNLRISLRKTPRNKPF